MFSRLRARLHAIFRALLAQHTSPGRLAAAVFVGVMVGFTPFFGFHILLCIGIAALFRLNQLVVYGAAHVSSPPLVPFIGFAAVQIGELVRHGHWMSLHLSELTWRNAPSHAAMFFVNWLIGGAIVGALVGALLAALTYRAARRRAALPPDPLGETIGQAAARYGKLHPRYSVYARMKYRMDPVYRAILPLVPPGAFTVDLGTGLGMLPVALALTDGRTALGIEWDKKKLAAGQEAARELPAVELREGDARAIEIPSCDVVTLVDMLHYYGADEQRTLLARCKAALRPGGLILIREGDADRRGGARLTRFYEWLVVKLGWNRGPRVKFRPARDLVADLTALGLSARVDEVASQTHPGNVLIIAELPQISQL
jgi:uncharacterized protein (DUF2062 family)/SAM-dependent methyltransferase